MRPTCLIADPNPKDSDLDVIGCDFSREGHGGPEGGSRAQSEGCRLSRPSTSSTPLNLRNQHLSHLALFSIATKKKTHDRGTLKRTEIEIVRLGAAKGQKVLYILQ